MTTDTDPSRPAGLDPERIAEVSLEQALLDFEVANARVLDLTRRLTELTNELLTVRQQFEAMRIAANQAQEENRWMKSSFTWRAVQLLGELRGSLRR